MKKYFLLLICQLIFGCKLLLIAQTNADTALASELQFALDNQFDKYNLKGVVMAISMPNNTIWYGESGTSNGSDTIKADMLFGIGSNTKTFTASLIMMLIEDGFLKLNDSLYHWIPLNPYIDSTITIKQLMNHTSGIYNYTDHPDIEDSLMLHFDKFWTPEEIINTFLDTAYFEKGTDFHYTNTNYILLGMIIKSITGNNISSTLHNRILDPLGLTHTFLDQEDSLIGELSHPWVDVFDNGTSYDLISLNVDRTSLYSSMWTAGAIFSTAEDMVKWSKALFQGMVLSDSSLQQMLDFLPYDDYGFGLEKYNVSGRELWGHGGDVIYKSLLMYSPIDTISIVLLCNDDNMVYSQMINITESVLNAYIGYLSNKNEINLPKINVRLFPNPSNSEINLEYQLNKLSRVSVDIYNMQCQKIYNIYNNLQNEGKHQITWNKNDISLKTGIYDIKISIDNNIKHIPIIISE